MNNMELDNYDSSEVILDVPARARARCWNAIYQRNQTF